MSFLKQLAVFVSILLCAGAWSAPATSNESYDHQNLDWHYTVRPSDSLSDIANRLLKPAFTWTTLAHYNRIEDVNELEVGSILKIPMRWLVHQPIPARIQSYDGEVLLKRRQTTRYSVVDDNVLLNVGDELLTRDGIASIEFADESTLSINRFSHIIFNRLSKYGETGMVDTRMRLNKGGVKARVNPLKPGSRYEISTPSAVAAVRGTEFRLRTNLDGTTLEVLEGVVEFQHQHGTKIVPAGQGARAMAQSALLDTIDLRSLPPISNKQGAGAILENKLQWQGLPEKIISDNTKQSSVTQDEGEDIRIAALALDTAAPSTSKSSEPTEKARLELPLPSSIISARGSTFSWSITKRHVLSRLELSRFKNFDTLAWSSPWSDQQSIELEQQIPAGNYFWRVRTLVAGQNETASLARRVSIQGMLEPVKILSVNYIGNQVGLFWNSVENARGYILQVSDDKEFRRVMSEETLQKTKAFMRLPEGKTYFARVKALGDEVFTSEYGELKEILVEPLPDN